MFLIRSLAIKRCYSIRNLTTTKYAPSISHVENEILKLEMDDYTKKHISNKFNKVIHTVPQQEVWVIERFGKFHKICNGGLNFLMPLIDKISYTFSLKEEALIIPNRSAITQDNVRVHIIGVLYYRVEDPYKAAYGAVDPIFALKQLSQTTLRSVIGEMTLDKSFHERNLVNQRVVAICNEASSAWGISCIRHEIREIIPPENILHSMELQVEAERKKRAVIHESEGRKQAEINTAEGERQSLLLRARGAAEGIERLGLAMQSNGGKDAVTFQVAMKYIESFEKLAKTSTTMIVPSSTADLASMIRQATAIVSVFGKEKVDNKTVSENNSPKDEVRDEVDENNETNEDKII